MPKVFEGSGIVEGTRELAVLLLQANYAMVLTGAGMDTESNIPDFRGKNGLWKNYDPRVVADISTFQQNYKLFHRFFMDQFGKMKGVKPHPGHYALAEFERRGLIKGIATQNISGLHKRAGSKNIYELHGSTNEFFCNNCGREATEEDMTEMKPCRHCGEYAVRPDVVLFGEVLPEETWKTAVNEIKKCDLLLVIGTSLEVSPVNQLPYLAKGKKVLLNNENISAGYRFDLVILGKAGEILSQLAAIIASICVK